MHMLSANVLSVTTRILVFYLSKSFLWHSIGSDLSGRYVRTDMVFKWISAEVYSRPF